MNKRILIPIKSPATAENILFSQNRAARKQADMSSAIVSKFLGKLESSEKNHKKNMHIRVKNERAKTNLPIIIQKSQSRSHCGGHSQV